MERAAAREEALQAELTAASEKSASAAREAEEAVEAAAEEDVRASACAARTEFLVARHPMPPRE